MGCGPTTWGERRAPPTRPGQCSTTCDKERRREASGPHLDERRVRQVGGREGSRPDARAALRHRGLRGHPLLRHGDRPGGLPPPRPRRPPVQVVRAVLHAGPVRPGADPPGDARADRPQRDALVLHPPDRLPRLRHDGPVPARRAGRRDNRRLGVGLLPRRGGQGERHPRAGVVLAAHQPRLADPPREGLRPVPELDPREDRVAQGRLRGGDPPRRQGLRVRGVGREHLRRARRQDPHAAADRLDPRRHQPQVDHADRRRPRLRARRARHRPRRALPRRRGLRLRHRRRAHAAARDRRPRDRRRAPGRDHARDPERLRGRAARPRRALPRVARPGAGRDRRARGPARRVTSVELYDATLRDGMQGQGMTLSAHEKLRVAHRLDELGVHLIEAGFPSSNPKELELFELLASERFDHAQIAAFGMTRRRGVRADEDEGLRILAACFAPVCTIVGKTWALHLDKVVRVDRAENLAMIAESVAFLVAQGKRVVYDAEHFFDGFRDDQTYALECLRAAADAGAETVCLCDTNGSSLPSQVAEATGAVVAALGGRVRIGFHGHNDAECGVANSLTAVEGGAGPGRGGGEGGGGGPRQTDPPGHNDAECGVANSLTAVEAGARQVQGTMNGVGERTGNANLVSIIANLQLKMAHDVVGAERLEKLTEVAHFVDELLNLTPDPNQPYVGKNAFAHKGGLHVAGVRADASTFEHVEPEQVGNARELLISELSGRGTAAEKAAAAGLNVDDAAAARIVERVKELEHAGYHFEAADGSFELLMRRESGEYEPLFTLESWRVIVEKRADGKVETEATIKIWVDGERYVRTAEGNGPVNALDAALRAAISEIHP